MADFQTYLAGIDENEQKERMSDILQYVKNEFPFLKKEVKWNQPMFSHHGTFIIGFSVAANHISVAPEAEVISLFTSDIEAAGYAHTKELFRIKASDEIDYDLLHRLISHNIDSKAGQSTFWR